MDRIFEHSEKVICHSCFKRSIIPAGEWITHCDCKNGQPLLRKLPEDRRYAVLYCTNPPTYVVADKHDNGAGCPFCGTTHNILSDKPVYTNGRQVYRTDSAPREDSKMHLCQRVVINLYELGIAMAEEGDNQKVAMERMNQELKEYKMKIKKLEEDLEAMRVANTELRNKNRDVEKLTDEVNKVALQLENERKRNDDLEKKVLLNQNSLETLSQLKNNEAQRLQKLEEADKAQKKRIETLERENHSSQLVKEENARLETVNKEKDELIKFLQEEHKKMSTTMLLQMTSMSRVTLMNDKKEEEMTEEQTSL